ncbi:MAG: peptide deformylase [Clostridia bacterium]|nr:peptide deformylase [Clostridia bacterium]
MAILNILKEQDPQDNETLRKKSRPVEKITPRILTLLDDMHETLVKAEGIGLAAPQVGVLRRIVIVEVGEDKFEMINPEIIESSGEQEAIEGCLSVPELAGLVKRPEYVKVRALDRSGKEYTAEGTGLLARCFCHELDHLDGVLYIDKAIETYTPDELEEE